jgi:multidrug resistance efflux pump
MRYNCLSEKKMNLLVWCQSGRHTLPAARLVACLAIMFSYLFAVSSQAWAIQPDMRLPEHWGMAPSSLQAAHHARPTDADAAARPHDLLAMPRGRLTIGIGTVNAADYLQQRGALASDYVLKAPKAGIVEWLSPLQRFFPAGFPLIRLYDTGIIPDLARAEAAARGYLDQPFTIAGPEQSHSDFPDFPSPTTAVSPRLAQVLPPVRPQNQPPSNPSGLQQQRPSSGLRMETPRPAASLAVATSGTNEPAKSSEVENFVEQLDQVRAQLASKRTQLSGRQAELGPLQERLAESASDLEARESLYERGMIAANTVKAVRSAHRALEAEVAELTQQCQDLSLAISALEQQQAELETGLEKARTTAQAQATASAPARNLQPRAARSVDNPSATPKARPAPAPQQDAQSSFPSPTVSRVEPALGTRAEVLGRSIQRLNSQEQRTSGRRRVELAPIPEALTRLAEPRWDTMTAPTSGLVLECLVADGEQVEAGCELLRVANTQWARMYADLSPEHLGHYRQGSPVLITFDEYRDVRFEGWINSLSPTDDGLALRAELYVLCTGGYWGADAYAMLRWLAEAAPVQQNRLPTMDPMTETVPEVYAGHYSVYTLLPIVPGEYGPARATKEKLVPGQYTGYMQVAQLEAAGDGPSPTSQDARQRLEKLARWRQSFTEGMTTTIFPNQLVLTYPADGEVRRAVEKMATGQVSNVNNRCARTMAEALGWGLGDAAQWASGLPRKGYHLRDDGLCRPGDILVWPFSYGTRRTQHVGIAVLQGGRMMMLSNLSGRLGTSEILPGYLAFHKPVPSPATD